MMWRGETVCQSKNLCLVGIAGIIIHETEKAFRFITESSAIKCKRTAQSILRILIRAVFGVLNSIFTLSIPLYSIILATHIPQGLVTITDQNTQSGVTFSIWATWWSILVPLRWVLRQKIQLQGNNRNLEMSIYLCPWYGHKISFRLLRCLSIPGSWKLLSRLWFFVTPMTFEVCAIGGIIAVHPWADFCKHGRDLSTYLQNS